ncbi:hypothetical protein B0H14DRAFT_3510672 [Mycena olivaceomarginata]|nr:hypothetical protein B0H14DRAFT_3510672 [Mycena olivaceomarginata]
MRVRRRIHSNVGTSNTSVIVKEQLEPHQQQICLAARELVRAMASTHRFLWDLPCISDVTPWTTARSRSPERRWCASWSPLSPLPSSAGAPYYRLSASPGWDYEITPRPTGPSLLFPASLDPPADDHSWLAHNARATAALFRCLERANCAPNQTKVVILQGWHFRGVLDGYLGGEGIWANSTVIALRRLGYTYLYTDRGLDPMVRLYRVFAPLVARRRRRRPRRARMLRDPYCACAASGPWGIPVWKILSFQLLGLRACAADHPLGRKWTLSPEPYLPAPENNTYLGYSVQPSCTQQPFIPHAQRARKQIYVYAKTADYFSPAKRAFPPHVFARLSAALGVDFVVGVQEAGAAAVLPAGVANLGGMGPARFYEAVASSWVLMGMGAPSTSPTPYDALCLGVPFINPILTVRDPAHPADRTKWVAQHEALKHLGPPHVYNVFKDDADGLEAAVRAALAAPLLDRYILPRMELAAVQARVGAILETDWRGAAEAVLAARVKAAADKGGASGAETEREDESRKTCREITSQAQDVLEGWSDGGSDLDSDPLAPWIFEYLYARRAVPRMLEFGHDRFTEEQEAFGTAR